MRAVVVIIHLVALLALSAFGLALGRTIREPTPGAVIALALVALLLLAGVRRLYRPGGLVRADVERSAQQQQERPPRKAKASDRALWAGGTAAQSWAGEPVSDAPEPDRPAPVPRVVAWPAPDPRVDLNAASVTDLQRLPGIGPVAAQRIVDERDAGGPFRSAEDLVRVPGIGPARVRVLADLVRV